MLKKLLLIAGLVLAAMPSAMACGEDFDASATDPGGTLTVATGGSDGHTEDATSAAEGTTAPVTPPTTPPET